MKRITLQFLRKWKPSFLASVGIGCVVLAVTVLPLGPNMSQGGLLEIGLDTIVYIISSIMYFFLIYVMGKFATLATNLVVMAAFFENFTTLPAIKEAWTVVRDLSNMMFIVILLLIAFGTLFRIEAYSWKKLLPKMILAAILMNYSRAIVGALVDASQIIMRTFAEAIAAAADVGIARAFNLSKLLSFGDTDPGLASSGSGTDVTPDSKQRLLGIVAAGLMLATLVVVQLVYATVLVGRLVMIWFLTVLYPLAIACMVLPATEKYFKQANELLARYITVGPMALFYLWLAMFIASKSTDLSTDITSNGPLKQLKNVNSSSAVSGALDSPVVANFIIATMMLLAGLKMAQDNASEMGSITSKASSVGQWVAKAPARLGAKGVGAVASYGNDVMYSKTGMDLNLVRVAGRWKEGLDKNRRDREMKGRSVASEKYQAGSVLAGALGAGDEMAEKGISLDQARGGVMGQVPLIGRWMNKQGFGLNKEARYNRAVKQEGDAQKTAVGAQKDVNDEEAKLRANHMTVEQFSRAKLAANTAAADGSSFEAGASNTGAYDLEKDKDARESIEARLSERQTALAAAPNDAAAAPIAAEIAAIEKALKTKGSQTFTGAINIKAGAGIMKTNRDTAAGRFNATNAERDMTDSGRLKTQDDLDKFVRETAPSMIPLRARLKSAQDDQAAATKARSDLRPTFSLLGEAKQRALVAEARKNVTTSDSSQLQAMFITALEDNRQADLRAILERMAETNNTNDALGALRANKQYNPKGDKFQFGHSGLVDLKELLTDKGMSEQAAMSTMHYISEKSGDNHILPFAQATEMKDQRIVFRDADTAMEIAIANMRKLDAMKVAREQGRQSFGDEFGDKNVSSDAKAALEAIASDMEKRSNNTQKKFTMIGNAFDLMASSPLMIKVFVDKAAAVHGVERTKVQMEQLFHDNGKTINVDAVLKQDLKAMLRAAGKDITKEFKGWV